MTSEDHTQQLPPTSADFDNNTQDFLNHNITSTPSHQHYIGTPITHTKPLSTFRLYCGNPNGLHLGLTGGDFSEYLSEMNRMQVDYLCLYEINLDTHQHQVKHILHDTTRNILSHCNLIYSSSAIPSTSWYKPGGTLSAGLNNTVGRIISSGQDPLGRWSYHTLAGKNQTKLTIISAYQVCIQPLRQGNHIATKTASAQQIRMLRDKNVNLQPRQAFLSDLSTLLTLLRHQNHEILLAGDFNETLEPSHGMSQLCEQFHLIDLMYKLTNKDDFNTYLRGSSRIDYILCTESIASSALAGCYEPFQFRVKGDHRNMVVDFDVQQLFGNPTYHIASPTQREFQSTDIARGRKYITLKHSYLQAKNFGSRLDSLCQNWDPQVAESLDRDFQRASKAAAKRCTRRPQTAYSQKLAALRKEKNVLLRLISNFRTGCSYSASIAYLTQDGHQFTLPSTLDACNQRCRQIRTEIRILERQHLHHRRVEQQHLLQLALNTGDKRQATAIRRKISAENTKMMYQKLRAARGQSSKSGISRLQVPAHPTTNYKSCIDWITIDTPKDIEEHLRQRNQSHFGQAQGTFPTIPPFSEWIDWGASTHISELILEGRFHPDNLTEMQNLLIQHMAKRTTLDSVPLEISISDWTSKIQAWPESTSTSPSGFHLSHSKALIAQYHINAENEEDVHFDEQRLQLIQWQVQLLNAALRNHYTYTRWNTIVNVMILKDPGNFKIHRLRVIHLYEHDYNMILAIKWRHLIQQATLNNLLHPAQFGGIPGRSAITPTLIEELQYEITRASKRPLVHLDYDATACYDRIIMSIGSLASRSFGQHRHIVLINAQNLHEAQYYLKTQLGVSDASYKHCNLFPIHGTGQGAGNSPAIWCCISSILFDMYDSKAHGATYVSPNGEHKVKITMIGFVDDTSGSVNNFLRPTPGPLHHYLDLAQQDAQTWNDILYLSGGALEDSKCSYQVLYYNYTTSGLPVPAGGTFTPTISIRFNNDPHPSTLRQLPASSSHKTLGVRKSPSGTTTAEYMALRLKNLAHATTIRTSPFNSIDAWTYYHSIYLPSITYSFPTNHLTQSQGLQLQREIKTALLPKLGFNRSTPNAIVYGHSDFAGLSVRNLPVERHIHQISLLISTLRSPGIARQLTLIALNWAQHLAGVSFNIMTHPSVSLPHLEPMQWIPSIRQGLSTLQCHMEITDIQITPLQRENDFFLVSSALTCSLSAMELRLFNACRLYLQVTLMSDICTALGTSLHHGILAGQRPPTSQPTKLYPYQPNPSNTAWRVWRRVLKTHLHPNSINLLHPLGRWFVTGIKTNRIWQSYYSPTTSELLIPKPTECDVYHKSSNRFEFSHSLPLLPTFAVPSDTDLSSSHIPPPLYSPSYPILKSSACSTFHHYIDTLDLWEQLLLSQTKFCHNEAFGTVNQILHHTNQSDGSLLIATDGSASNFLGKFGLVLALSNGTRLVRNNGPALGYRTSSFRAECYGMLASLSLCLRLFDYTGNALPSRISLYTDSESLLLKLQSMLSWPYYYPSATLQPDWDILQMIITSLRKFPVMPTLTHVKGHQDTTSQLASLSLPARLNIEADNLASQYHYPTSLDPNTAAMFPNTTVLLHSAQGTISSHYRNHLRRISSEPAMTHYICSKNQWTVKTFRTIDWDAHGQVIRRWYAHKKFITKYLHDWLPVGKLVQKYDSSYTSACPSCATLIEDREHFLCCPNRPWRELMLTTLTIHLRSLSTNPILADILLSSLRQWFLVQTVTHPSYPPQYQSLLTNQNKIGWHHLLLGRFAVDWADLQQEYIHTRRISNKLARTGTHWVVQIVDFLWTHIYKAWHARNEAKHGADSSSKENAQYDQARRETEALYVLAPHVLPRDRDLFYPSLDDHCRHLTSANQLRQWLLTWKPLILRSIQMCNTLNLAKNHNIKSFFAPVTPSSSSETRRSSPSDFP